MNTKTFLSIFNSIETVINSLVRTIVNIFTFAITEMAPMVAPLPPAFSIYTAMYERLHVPMYVAVIAAIAIEIIGMFSSKVSIRCYQWNRARNKTEQTIPQTLSIAMTATYFIVVLLLALTVELLPNLVSLVIPGFVLIAISVYVNLAIHVNLEKLETDKACEIELRQEKNGLLAQIRVAKKDLEHLVIEAKSKRSELATLAGELAGQQQAKSDLEITLGQMRAQVATGQNGSQDGPNWPGKGVDGGQSEPAKLDKANETRQAKIDTRRAKLASLLAENGQLTNQELAGELGVGVSTIKNDKKVLNGNLIKSKGA
jgi:hypothetical protein